MRAGLRRLGAGLGLALLLLAGLVWLAPATWLDRALHQASRGNLGLAGAEGTVWAGRGSLQAVLPDGHAVTLAPLRWQVRLGELWRGRVRLSVQAANDGRVLLEVSLGPARAEVHGMHLEFPAALLGSLSPTLREATPGGSMVLAAEGFRYDAGRFMGRAVLEWHDATSGLAAVRPLGSYRMTLEGRDPGLSGRLDSLGEPALALSGRFRWQPGRAPDLEVDARPAPDRLAELAPLLRILGRETSPGNYRLQLDPGVGAL